MSQASIPPKGTANKNVARGSLPKNKSTDQPTPCFKYAFQSWKIKRDRGDFICCFVVLETATYAFE